MERLITEEVAKAVRSYFKKNEPAIEKHEFERGDSVCIGFIQVCRAYDDSCPLILREGVGKEYIKSWRSDIGQFVLKDFKNKRFDQYYKFSMNDTTVLLREIPDEELPMMDNRFINLNVCDKAYTIVRIYKNLIELTSFDLKLNVTEMLEMSGSLNMMGAFDQVCETKDIHEDCDDQIALF